MNDQLHYLFVLSNKLMDVTRGWATLGEITHWECNKEGLGDTQVTVTWRCEIAYS